MRRRQGARRPCRRARVDLGEETREGWVARHGVVAEHEGDAVRPAPYRHVDDRVALAEHVAVRRQAVFHDLPVALRLEAVALLRVGQLLRREVVKVDALAGVGPDAAGDEHQPGEEGAALRRRVLGQELATFLGQVQQDRVAVEERDVAVDESRHLAVGIDGPERRGVLLAGLGVDGDGRVGQARLLEEQGDLHGIRCGVEIELHGVSPRVPGAVPRCASARW